MRQTNGRILRLLSPRLDAARLPSRASNAISGRRVDAGTLKSLLARSRTEYVAAPCIAELYVALGDPDSALEWLEKAVEQTA